MMRGLRDAQAMPQKPLPLVIKKAACAAFLMPKAAMFAADHFLASLL
jgi:hypothetical protein